jgi:uncharacterized protein YdhG (YjbR/CyaY superfamily)
MAGPASVEEYFAGLPDDAREALQALREQIRAVAPDATESIAYQMPAFRQNGKFLVSYAAFKDHCSLFPGTDRMLEEFGDEIAPYMSGKGTIRFTVDEPLPAELVEKVVRSRLADLADE